MTWHKDEHNLGWTRYYIFIVFISNSDFKRNENGTTFVGPQKYLGNSVLFSAAELAQGTLGPNGSESQQLLSHLGVIQGDRGWGRHPLNEL